MWSAVGKAFRDGFGVSFENDGEVWPFSFRIELPQKYRVNAVEALHDQT
jgi:hypothetical protein